MYFKSSGRHNPQSGKHDWYYRLVESYRNSEGRICHRTVLNIGFLKQELSVEQLDAVSRLLTDRYLHKISLFGATDELVNRWANDLWQRIITEKRLDLTLFDANSRKIDADTMQHSNVRKGGTEWMLYNIWQELKIDQVLAEHDFTEEEIKLAQTQIISRAVHPASELSIASWTQENSAICELTGYPLEKLNKDKLYKSALKLYTVKDVLEQHLSVRTQRTLRHPRQNHALQPYQHLFRGREA